jgi:uncharacterized protein YhbP (UPF0306 family)
MSGERNITQTAYALLTENRYMAVGVVVDGRPWVAALAFTWLSDGTLAFYSAADSRHIQGGSDRGLVAGTVFDSHVSSDDVSGIQFAGTLSEVEIAELPSVMDRYFIALFPHPADRERWSRPPDAFSPPAPQRFYRVTLSEAFVLDEQDLEVDKRLAVDLDELAALRARAH